MLFQVDSTPPVCGQTSDVVETTPLGSPGTPVQFTEPQATDNSGTVTLRSRTHSTGQFFQVGTTQVCYTFADPSQNTVDCCFNVIVTEGEFGHKPISGESPVIERPRTETILKLSFAARISAFFEVTFCIGLERGRSVFWDAQIPPSQRCCYCLVFQSKTSTCIFILYQ